MHTASTSTGTPLRWLRVLAILALTFMLAGPLTASAQGLKGNKGTDQATEEATQESTGDETPQAQDPEEAGLQTDTSYESPQFGYAIEWSKDWAVDTWYDDPANTDQGPSVKSNTKAELDQIYLAWSGRSDATSYAIFSGQTANRGGAKGDVKEWTDKNYIADQWAENFDVKAISDDTKGKAGAVIFSVYDTDQDYQYYTIYQSIELKDGTTLYITFSGYEDYFIDGYTSFSEDVTLNGDPIDLVFTVDDAQAAIDDNK